MRMNSPKQPAVYILASKRNGTLYTGVTSDMVKRIWQHKNDLADGFTKQYSVHLLVYFELADEMATAIEREKQIKGGSRAKKIAMIAQEFDTPYLDFNSKISLDSIRDFHDHIHLNASGVKKFNLLFIDTLNRQTNERRISPQR